MIFSIVLVTSAQPSANPRLLKEVKTLYNEGFSVSVVWAPISPWADQFDQKLFKEFPSINWLKAGYHYKLEPLGYWYARIRQAIWKIIYMVTGNQFDAPLKSLVLYSQELATIASNIKADLYIGHNLGSLFAVVKSATKHNANSIFDFEDYHHGEYPEDSDDFVRIKQIENKFIPLLSSISSASPAITHAYKNLFPKSSMQTIINCFPLSYSFGQLFDLQDQPLKLFWFSQYLGKKRGLETVIESMSNFSNNQITLTLLGTASKEIKLYFQSLSEKLNLSDKQLIFLDSVSEKEIVQIAAQHHIGLASEYAHNANRDLCLTNKIFTYLLAGNAVVLSDTHAQKSFLSENPAIGSLFEQNNVQQLTSVFKTYMGDSKLLLSHRQNALDLAKNKYNWDIEKQKFLDNVNYVLAS